MAHCRCFLSLAILVVVPFLIAGTNQPRLEITLISSPRPEATQKAFHVYNPETKDYEWTTQDCYRVELRFKNLGPGSIVFPYRGMFSVEIQRTNSTEWIGANQIELGWLPPPLRPGASQDCGARIPANAVRWRVHTTYRRWHLPTQFVNYISRDFLHSHAEFGDQKDYDVESAAWDLSPVNLPP